MAPSSVPLAHHLDRVRLMLRRQVLIRAAWLPGIQDGPSGQALVEFLMADGGPPPVDPDVERINRLLDDSDHLIVSGDAVGARFEALRARLGLTALQGQWLWLILAPEFDSRFLAVYRLLWGDLGRRYCDEDFLLTMLAPDGPNRLHGVVNETSALTQLDFVHRIDRADAAPLFRPDERLLQYLSGRDEVSELVSPLIQLWEPGDDDPWAALTLHPPLFEACVEEHERGGCALIRASRRAGMEALTNQVARRVRAPVVRLDLQELITPPSPETGYRESVLFADECYVLKAILREARLVGAIIHMRGIDALDGETLAHCRELAELIAREPALVVLECEGVVPVEVLRTIVPRVSPRPLVATNLDTEQRRAMWRHALGGTSEAEVKHLAGFPLGPREVGLAITLPRAAGVSLVDVCQQLSAQSLSSLASRVEVDMGWEDVVLPADIRGRLEEIRSLGRHYERIMTAWGLGRIHTGRGVKVLFSGPSGTGKTLVAGLLSQDLGRELYRVDLAAVVSKYIGDTDKHLRQLFRSASSAGVALLFDEADSLFAKRTQAKSSVDRYANQTVNFLLQELESYDGLVVLTTNLSEVIDSAFVRRLHYHVRFKRPGFEERQRLWELHLPPDMPLGDDVSLEELAELYDLTGGEIRKATIRAAVNAVRSDSGMVDFDALEAAARTEYVENGRLPPPLRRDGF